MSEDRDKLLDQVAEEFIEQYRTSGHLEVGDFCARYPELAEDIKELFPALLRLEQARPNSPSGLPLRPALHAASSNDDAVILGDYRIVREIGHGGMGIVYEALQESLRRPVALKVLSPAVMQSPRHVQRFELEARAAALLHHSNIVPILGVGEAQGFHYLVMQLIHGAALDEIMHELRAQLEMRKWSRSPPPSVERGKPAEIDAHSARPATAIASWLLSGHTAAEFFNADKESPQTTNSSGVLTARCRRAYWRHIASIGLQAAEALAYATSQGVVHRDIKPANVLIDLQGTAWIADFGLAKTTEENNLTRSGEFVGTVRYLPPERLRGIDDARGDIYGLGATLYELATLRQPFADCDGARMLAQVLDVEPARPRSIEREIPRDLETIIVKAMAKDLGDRYQTPAHVASDLRNFLQDLPITARRTSLPERCWRWCRRHPAVAVPTTAAIVLSTVVVVGSVLVAARLGQENQVSRAAEHRAVSAERARSGELFRAHVTNARGAAASGHVGQRFGGLQAIREALSVVRPDTPTDEQHHALIDAAIPCLAGADVREVYRSPKLRGKRGDTAVHPSFESYTMPAPQGSGAVLISCADGSVQEFLGDPNEISTFLSARTFSPRATWLAEHVFRSRDDDSKRTRVWRTATREVALDIVGIKQGLAFAFHPDERHFLVAGNDSALRKFDLETGQIVSESLPRFHLRTILFSPDGKLLVLCNSTGPAELVDATTWKTIDILHDAGPASSSAFNDNGLLAIGCADGRIYLWNKTTRSGRFLPGGFKTGVIDLAFASEGGLLVSTADDTTQIMQHDGDHLLLTLPGEILRISPDGSKLAVHDRGRLITYELATAPEFRTVVEPHAEAAAFSPDGRWLALSGRRGVGLYNSHDWKRAADFGLEHCGPVAFEPSGKSLVTMGIFTQACRWPIEDDGDRLKIGPPRALFFDQMPDFAATRLAPQHQGREVAFDAQGRLAVADYRHSRVLTAAVAEPPLKEFAQLFNVGRLAVSNDGRWMAGAAVYSPVVRVWNAQTAETLLELSNHHSVAFSADSRWLATRSGDAVHLYRTDTWQRVHCIELESSRGHFFLPLAFQPGGKLLAVAGPLQNVMLYDRESARLVARLPHSDEGIFSHLAFSPDGSRLVVVRSGLGFSIWDLRRLQSDLVALGLPAADWVAKSTVPPTSAPTQRVTIDTSPLSPDLWYRCWERLAQHEANEKQWPDAIRDIYAALNLVGSEDSRAVAALRVKLGEYHLLNDEHAQARDSWRSALALKPESLSATRNLAWLLLLGPSEVRDATGAIASIAILEDRGELADEVTILKALVHIRRADFAAADVAQLQGAVENAPLGPFASYALALVHRGRAEPDLASHALANARELHDQLRDALSDMQRVLLDELRAEVESALATGSVALPSR